MKIRSTLIAPVIAAAGLAATHVQAAIVTGWADANTTGMQIDTSIIRTADSVQMGAISFLDTSIFVTEFYRVGFLFGGNLDVGTVQFNNITVIPEPCFVASVFSARSAAAVDR